MDQVWIMRVQTTGNHYEGLDSLQRSINFADEINWLFQADYIHPFGKVGKIEAGVKTVPDYQE